METTITYQLDHASDDSDRLETYIYECLNLKNDGAICDICEERIVELAIRKEFGVLFSVTTAILTFQPEEDEEKLRMRRGY